MKISDLKDLRKHSQNRTKEMKIKDMILGLKDIRIEGRVLENVSNSCSKKKKENSRKMIMSRNVPEFTAQTFKEQNNQSRTKYTARKRA